ncbi:SDR family oxidoreductase [Nonomuraea insulae]|uniref:SDR family oxidoreductase n=1 Tax=Nonomuraea insulae TaxID=1616787 RepID=A0ABW1CRC6_9ACTN
MGVQKRALITGANKGIGFETARLLAEQGVTAIVAARDEDRGRAAAARLGQPYVRLDVTDADSVRGAAAWVEEEFGTLDILVNNAGIIGTRQAQPSATPLDLVRQVYETNVFGVVTVTNAMLPLLRRSPAGRIVNVSSELGSMARVLDRHHPIWGQHDLAYNSSKAALNMIMITYAKELWDTPIKVNSVDPGWCATDATDHTGFRTAEQGARQIVRLATIGDDGPTAAFYLDERPLPW